jgi:hypothetical protein
MSCGNLFLQDPLKRIWILSANDNGTLITSLTAVPVSGLVAPALTSPSYYWQLSATVNGVITATPVVATSASSSYLLSSISGKVFLLTILDTGVLLTSAQVGGLSIQVPYPTDVSMSQWPNLGLTSSIAGATPLTVNADYSIWSCTLNRYVNEDTTNIIVVLDE